jgi:Kef-type K+ transport system membrane component KefB/mannitol/fructose-specific phosphotransferase system IIA component
MENLNHNQITVLFLGLGLLLASARVLGEAAQRFKQPAVLGELLAGILLGPTVFGHIAPELSSLIFPAKGPNAVALNTISNVAIVLFLMVAGIEVDLSTVWRQGKLGLKVGATSIVIPFAIGFAIAFTSPPVFGGAPNSPMVFSLFIAIALSISALPVIAKTLMDMDLYRSDLGMIVVSAAIFNDLVGWILFAFVLGSIGNPAGSGPSIVATLIMILGFSGFMLTAGRYLIHKAFPYIQAYTRWPGGELSFAVILSILGAAFTEWIGIHAIFGAFLVGAAVGDSSHLRERTRFTIAHFVSFIFAPVFFASIGLKVDFIAHFNPVLTGAVFIIACLCKLAGGTLGALWGGMPRHESLAVGFAMNSRGAMEIILGLLALQAGIIHQELFVALVVMAIATSMISGPFMRIILKPAKVWHLHENLSSKYFLRELRGTTREEAIRELAEAACVINNLPHEKVTTAVLAREESMSTGIGNGVALPHARIDGIKEAAVVMGISQEGIDFDAPDDRLAHVLFLILTPVDEPGIQLTITSELARLFKRPHILDQILRIKSHTDFIAFLRATSTAENLV